MTDLNEMKTKVDTFTGLDVVSPVSDASVGFKVSADSSVELPASENRYGNETWKPNPRK